MARTHVGVIRLSKRFTSALVGGDVGAQVGRTLGPHLLGVQKEAMRQEVTCDGWRGWTADGRTSIVKTSVVRCVRSLPAAHCQLKAVWGREWPTPGAQPRRI